jgi:amino-acid N-acetyltransferase
MAPAPIASKPERAAVAALLDAFDLPSADLTDAHMEHFFFCGPAAAPTALVGVELCGSSALLRSLVVRPEHRATGLGAALVEHAEAYAHARGARAIYLLTTTAAAFFARLDYATAERASAPPEIAATREFASICPASSAFMTKQLTSSQLSPSGRRVTPSPPAAS